MLAVHRKTTKDLQKVKQYLSVDH